MANYLHRTRDPVDYRTSTGTTSLDDTASPDPVDVAVNWFKNPDVSAVAAVPTKYWARPLTDPVTEMTQPEKDAVDAAELAVETAAIIQAAKDFHDDLDADNRALRATVRVLVDELNILRKQWRDFQVEVAASNNLGNFQARVATLPTLNDRTYEQSRTAIGSQIDGE